MLILLCHLENQQFKAIIVTMKPETFIKLNRIDF